MDKKTLQLVLASAAVLVVCIAVAANTAGDTFVHSIAWVIGLVAGWMVIMGLLIRKWEHNPGTPGSSKEAKNLLLAKEGLSKEAKGLLLAKERAAEKKAKRDAELSKLKGFVGRSVAGRYEVREEVGRGGFGTVYLAFDQQAEEHCALKTFNDELLSNVGAQKAFRNELKLWLNLGRHPNIVEAQSIESDSGRLFLKMEYIRPDSQGSVTLQDHLQADQELIHGQLLLDWAIHICKGMEHALSRGMNCHLDLKPANILIQDESTAKLSDFGLAMAANRAFSFCRNEEDDEGSAFEFMLSQSIVSAEGKHFTGTIGYLPPEVATGIEPSVKNDVYAFGIILWQLSTGLPVSPWLTHVDPEKDPFAQVLFRQLRESLPKVGEPLDRHYCEVHGSQSKRAL